MFDPYSDPEMAAVYHRVSAPSQFRPPALDLVALLRLPKGALVLDIGTGTGVVGAEAAAAVGAAGKVVGVDSSQVMLRFARETLLGPLVLAALPHLPFRTDTFAAVMAGFVISHVTDYQQAMAEMVRACRPNGRVGITAWGSLPNPAAQLWSEVAGQFVPGDRLDDAFRRHIPWDGWFSALSRLRQALEDADLVCSVIETRVYRLRMPTGDFLASREASIQGAVLREELTLARWSDFRNQVAEHFHRRFGRLLEYDRDVHFAIGTKPPTSVRPDAVPRVSRSRA